MEQNSVSLKELYKDYFRLGAACERVHDQFTNNEIGNPPKEALMLKHFNSTTFGNELKPAYNMGWRSPEAREDYLPFVINDGAKLMLEWCRKNEMPLRGHVMIWHSQCAREAFCKGYEAVTFPTDPELLKEKPFLKFMEKLNPVCFVDRLTLLKRMRSYILSLVEYMYANGYGRMIYAWDVVNEAIELEDKTETGLRNSYWYQIIGDDFIYWAFKFAKEAVEVSSLRHAAEYGVDPADKEAVRKLQPSLIYNDYNEFYPDKKEAIIKALSRCGDGSLKRSLEENQENSGTTSVEGDENVVELPDGTRYILGNRTHGSILSEGLIDGIGMQGHVSDNNSVEDYLAALKEYASIVNEVQITELDVKCTCSNKNAEYYQAVFYKKLFEGIVAAKKEGANVTGVTFWGLTDDNSWIRGADPLLFRGDLSEKKSFNALVYAITGESLGEPEKIVYNLDDRRIDFAEAGEKGLKAEDIGFKMRGFGGISITDALSHSGKYCLENEKRFGDWCGPSINVSDFIGQTIRISVWVKSPAEEVRMFADIGGNDPLLAAADTRDGGWKQLQAEYRVPGNVYSMFLYFLTKEATQNTFSPIYLDDIELQLVGLAESFEDEFNIASIRGVGHLPFCYVTDKEAHNGVGHSYCVTRQEKDATMKFNISQYVGHRVKVTAYVKTTDSEIRMGLDGKEPHLLCRVDNIPGEWMELKAEFELDAELNSAEMYIETDGNADFYVDDILCELGTVLF